MVLLAPKSVLACAACFGESDSPLAKGMNWGILSVMGSIGLIWYGRYFLKKLKNISYL